MVDIGALNCIVDEIGNNLLGSQDMLNMYIETFDQGKIDNKLIKNSADNKRVQQIDGRVPCNLLLFGTPVAILDGHNKEKELFNMMDTGYGRRCFFSYTPKLMSDIQEIDDIEKAAKDIFDSLVNGTINTTFSTFSDRFSQLASYNSYNKKIPVPREVSEYLLMYKLYCEQQSDRIPEYESIRKAEWAHRYFKVLKLAGAYAFYDGTVEVTKEQVQYAIYLAEESGKALADILNRDSNYVRLAKFIAEQKHELTHPDIAEKLPWYKGSAAHRTELIQMATAWGYKNHTIIKKSYNQGIELLSADRLEETDTDKCIMSFSNHQAYNYFSPENDVKFETLHLLMCGQTSEGEDYHWINHKLTDGHRQGASVIRGFNLLVLDVDGGASIDQVRSLLSEYKYFIHTTKRHTPECNRFRVILPINYTLKLSKEDYRSFCNSIFDWFPFDIDPNTNQRAKKWLSCKNAQHWYNDGELLDVLSFIPRTARNTEREESVNKAKSLDNLERWFVMNTGNGNRSANLVRYALMLVDNGKDLADVREAVYALNNKLPESITKREIDITIMTSAAKRFQSLNQNP